MGVAAKQFHNPDDRTNTLAYRVRPSDEQLETQRERWNDLAEILLEKLGNDVGRPASSWLQGSYKFGTQIRPAHSAEEFDIDLGVYLEWRGEPEDGGIDPLDLKNRVQKILEDYADDPTTDAERAEKPKARCNRVTFSGSFHIDVPSYHLDRSGDRRDLATEDGTWEDSDPKAIYVWWKDQHEGAERDRARRLVRYIKMWAALKFKNASRPSSILLTVLVAEALRDIESKDLAGDDEFLNAVINRIHTRLRRSSIVRNPRNRSENLNRMGQDDFDCFIDGLKKLIEIAGRALDAEDVYTSSEIWSEAFSHFFPLPEGETFALAKEARDERTLPFSARHDPEVEVVATNGRREWKGVNRIGPIPRGSSLEFTVRNAHTFPYGSTIDWTVRNHGFEAEIANDMGHVNRSGPTAEEGTSYKGMHYMDVTVRHIGRVIGRRRVSVEVSGLGLPQRNPGRPAWTRLR